MSGKKFILVALVNTLMIVGFGWKALSYPTNYLETGAKLKNENDINSIYERMAKERVIFIGQEINDELATQVIAVMLYLDDQEPGKDIILYLNSPGGYITSTLAIYDAIQSLKSDVVTICVNLCASSAGLLLAAGTPGKRLALPNARVMLHNPSPGAPVPPNASAEVNRIRHNIHEILAQHTGQPIEKIEKDLEHDFFMSAQEAKEYGIIDRVIEERKPE